MASKFLSLIREAVKKSTVQTEFEVLGIKYVLAPTSTKDEFLLADSMSKLSEDPENFLSAMQSIRARTLASMLVSVGGEEIPEYFPLENGEKMERALFMTEEISSWPAVVVDALYSVASDFKKKIRDTVKGSVKYEWFGDNLLATETKEEEDIAKMDELAEQVFNPLSVVKETDAPEKSSFETPAEP
jgi:hypothetical protein